VPVAIPKATLWEPITKYGGDRAIKTRDDRGQLVECASSRTNEGWTVPSNPRYEQPGPGACPAPAMSRWGGHLTDIPRNSWR
jgi:hypothetical protein